MTDLEKLGAFYLGTTVDDDTPDPVLYDARDLTTHAVCVGMTGSGKTGLCLALIEEALLDGVPVIAIDPKGDLGNLALTFPALAGSDFEPWVDPAQAQRDGVTTSELAARTARTWRDGLAASGQTPERIARLRAASEVAIYTPGSNAGRPISVLRNFRAPPPELDGEAWRDRVEGAVSGLLALVGIAADPLRSREHVLLSQLLDAGWRTGQDVALAQLIQQVAKPPFQQVGAFDLETFYPAKERTELALALNTLLASPSFAAWTAGEPLDIPSLLYGAGGKPRASVMSIAHLGDAERMFFVTLLLQEVISWMRGQPGTSSLRAIVFMDEVAGYLPPVAAPPSKKPMLTLLKQARAFGLGIVVATQNPVDLDYKALSNAGTWLLGRLQTERDQARVLDGLEGACSTAGKPFDRAAMSARLGGLGQRQFVLNNVHDDHPIVLQTRWVMSYLAGPMTRAQLAKLTPSVAVAPSMSTVAPSRSSATRPVVASELPELFLAGARLAPSLCGVIKVHYAAAKVGIDTWSELVVVSPLSADSAGDYWEHATLADKRVLEGASSAPAVGARFDAFPAALNAKAIAKLGESLEAWIYRAAPLAVWQVPELDLVSHPGETEAAFRGRLALAMREARDAAVTKLRAKHQAKLDALADKLTTARRRTERERAQATSATADSAISVGASMLGAIFGSRRGSLGKAASAARSVSRTLGQRGDVARAEQATVELEQRISELESQISADAAEIVAAPVPEPVPLEVRAKKADSVVVKLALLWRPA